MIKYGFLKLVMSYMNLNNINNLYEFVFSFDLQHNNICKTDVKIEKFKQVG